ncbi:MAG: hypothetical protein ABSD13_20650, partial [Candidatus Korobacteraceae bacterium]
GHDPTPRQSLTSVSEAPDTKSVGTARIDLLLSSLARGKGRQAVGARIASSAGCLVAYSD